MKKYIYNLSIKKFLYLIQDKNYPMTNNHDKIHDAPETNQSYVIWTHHQDDAHHIDGAAQS